MHLYHVLGFKLNAADTFHHVVFVPIIGGMHFGEWQPVFLKLLLYILHVYSRVQYGISLWIKSTAILPKSHLRPSTRFCDLVMTSRALGCVGKHPRILHLWLPGRFGLLHAVSRQGRVHGLALGEAHQLLDKYVDQRAGDHDVCHDCYCNVDEGGECELAVPLHFRSEHDDRDVQRTVLRSACDRKLLHQESSSSAKGGKEGHRIDLARELEIYPSWSNDRFDVHGFGQRNTQ